MIDPTTGVVLVEPGVVSINDGGVSVIADLYLTRVADWPIRARVAFYVHDLNLNRMLSTPFGNAPIPSPTPRPGRLAMLVYEAPQRTRTESDSAQVNGPARSIGTMELVSDPDFSHLAELHELGDQEIPAAVFDVAAGFDVELVWRNELGGLTFRCVDRFIKWNPRSTGIDLGRERARLEWIAARHPAPRVVDWGEDESSQWMVTSGLPGDCAVGDVWRARRPEAIRAIAIGLRAIHAVSIDDFPESWTSQVWVGQRPQSLGAAPPVDRAVLVHGDACAPNTLVSPAGAWVGHVDFGDLAVGDAWADLAVASLSLDWNFGEGHQHEFFDAYGVEPDEGRIRYYRELWQLAS